VLTRLLAAALLLPFAAHAADPIRVPAITPLTGPVAAIGQDVKKGIDVAVEVIKASGGFAGRPVTVEVVDTQAKPEVVRREMERLTADEHTTIIQGCEASAGMSSAAQFGEKAGVPMLNGLAAVEVFDRGYQWYFSQQVTNDDFAQAAVGFTADIAGAKGLAGTPIALLNEDSPNGAGNSERIRQILEKKGIAPVVSVSYNRAERNFLPIMTKIAEAKPAVVIWTGYTADVVAGLGALGQLEFYPYVVGIGGGLGDPKLPTLVDLGLLRKIHAANVDYFSPGLKRAAYFVAAYKAKYGVEPSSYAASCYASLFTIKAAYEAALAKTANPTRADIAAALRGLDIPGDKTITPARYIKFDATGRNTGARAVVSQWQTGADVKVPVWPADLALAPATKLP
jgi:branched-chain amino acid transport system substrate-binding protein